MIENQIRRQSLVVLGVAMILGGPTRVLAQTVSPIAPPTIDASATQQVGGLTVAEGSTIPLTATVIARHPNGELRLRKSVVEGRADGAWLEWFEDGAVRLYAEWRAGLGHGVWVYFHPNGEIRERSQVREDIWHGVTEGWHENGAKAFEGRFEQGVRPSPPRRWDQDGEAVGPWTLLAGGPTPREALDATWPADIAPWEFSFTPDLETLFVSTGQADGSNRRILVRRWRNGAWTAPEAAPFANGEAAEGSPVVSLDGRHVYFSSDRHSRSEPGNPHRDLYRASAASGWMTVERVTNTAAYGEITLSVADDGTGVMWTDRRTDGAPQMGLYAIRFDDAEISSLDAVSVAGDLNALHSDEVGNENAAAIMRDGQAVIFANYNIGGQSTGEDLFIVRREGSGWSAPVPLGARVNTAGTESSPQLLNDGRTLAWRYDGPGVAGIRLLPLSEALSQ